MFVRHSIIKERNTFSGTVKEQKIVCRLGLVTDIHFMESISSQLAFVVTQKPYSCSLELSAYSVAIMPI